MTGDDYKLTDLVSNSVPESGVTSGSELVRFVDAVLLGSPAELEMARSDVLAALGPAAFVDTCATVASFNAVVKIADGTGIPLEDDKATRTHDLRTELGINALRQSD